MPDRLADVYNVKDFGAIGTGAGELLSTRYATLANARVDYPFVTSLSDTIDWAAIQAAINAMWASPSKGGTVFIPSGNYVVKQGIDIGNHGVGSTTPADVLLVLRKVLHL